MLPERIAELRQLLARRRHYVELHEGGECGIHRELRDTYADLSHAMVKYAADLLATAEREAKLREAVVIVANSLAMLLATRISPEDGLIADIHKDLRAALEQKGGEHD